jgi:hypothetical protein
MRKLEKLDVENPKELVYSQNFYASHCDSIFDRNCEFVLAEQAWDRLPTLISRYFFFFSSCYCPGGVTSVSKAWGGGGCSGFNNDGSSQSARGGGCWWRFKVELFQFTGES